MKAHLSYTLLATLALAPELTPWTANADTINVPGDYPTIQEAIFACQDGDTVLVADGVYIGVFNKNIDFGGLAITVRSENGPENCIIDCEGDGRGFYFHSGETSASVVDGFTIINGSGSNGGGMACVSWSSPTITNCTIRANHSGGLYLESSPTIIGCTIDANLSGRGIYCDRYCTSTITDCAISANSSDGVYLDRASVTLANCIISGNGRQGVAGYAAVSIVACVIEYNSGTGVSLSGGSISNSVIRANDGVGVSGNGAVDNCVVEANSGGGLNLGPGTIESCTVEGNAWDAVIVSSGTVKNCTIFDNDGRGIVARAADVVSCMVEQNLGTGIYIDYGSSSVRRCEIRGNVGARGGVYIAVLRGRSRSRIA